MAQTTFDPKAYNEQYQKIISNTEWDATIYDILETKAKTVFGEDCESPERDVIVVYFEIEGGERRNETYSLPASPGSWKRENFKLGQFVRRYGEVPRVGLKIKVIVNKDAFWRIVV